MIAGLMVVMVNLLAVDARADTTRMTPDTVLRHPDQSQPLAQRWEWGRTQAGKLSRRAYWIGFTVKRPTWLRHSVYVDDVKRSGGLFGDFHGPVFRGVRLAPIAGTSDSDDIAMLFGFTADAGGRPALSNAHVASVSLPMDFRGRTLFWLGPAVDAQSLPIVQGLLGDAAEPNLRADVVAAIGILGSSDVVPMLQGVATSDPSTAVRRAALETLAERAPTAETVHFLTNLAINAQADIARAAVEALGGTGDLGVPVLMEIARTHPSGNLREVAVEGLGKSPHADSVVAFLGGLARATDDEDMANAAVKALGEMHDARALAIVARTARGDGKVDLRQTAIEAYTVGASRDSTLALLKSILASDAPQDVYTTVLEQLEGMDDGAGIPALTQAARSHPNREVRADALRRLAESDDPRAQQVFERTLRRP